MDGLLLSGGADIDPARYGQPLAGSVEIEPDRDALEADAWSAAIDRSVPVLGLCRGLQAINVFSGGTLLQHVPGHVGHAWGRGPATIHPIRLVPASELARIVAEPASLEVNSYHHQGIRPADLAPGLVALGLGGQRGRAVDRRPRGDGRPVHRRRPVPPRAPEVHAAAFERLFAAFVAACRAEVAGARPRAGRPR